MNILRFFLALVVTVSATLIATAEKQLTDAKHCIAVRLQSGEIIKCKMDKGVTFSFTENELAIECGESHPLYAIQDVAGFKYEETDLSGVAGIKNDNMVSYEFDGNRLILSLPSVRENQLSIYSIDGKLMESIRFDTSCNLDLSSYPYGVYTVRVNADTIIKILKK